MIIKTIADDELFLPKRAHHDDAGFDLRCTESFILRSGECIVMPAGIKVEIPYGYFGKIESRSGLFIKGVLAQGVVDAGFRGPVKVIMWNLSDNDISFEYGDRIAQMVILPLADLTMLGDVSFQSVNELNESSRGASGYGSTGLK